MNRRKEACHCKNVTYGMIEDAIRNGANTLQQVMDATGAGKGCGKCKEFLAYLIRDIQEERIDLPDDPENNGCFGIGKIDSPHS